MSIKNKQILKTIITYTIIFTLAFILSLKITHTYGLARVCGESMEPTLQDGDILIVRLNQVPKDQDIIVLTSDGNDAFEHDELVKRYYAERSNENQIWVEGDNKEESLDSRLAGTLNRENINGIVVFDITKFFRDLF